MVRLLKDSVLKAPAYRPPFKHPRSRIITSVWDVIGLSRPRTATPTDIASALLTVCLLRLTPLGSSSRLSKGNQGTSLLISASYLQNNRLSGIKKEIPCNSGRYYKGDSILNLYGGSLISIFVVSGHLSRVQRYSILLYLSKYNSKKMNGSEVINMILTNEDVKAASFARKIGVTPAQIYDLQKGKIKGVSSNVADKILAVYPRYNKSWILTGIGEMLAAQQPEKEKIKITIAEMPKLAETPNKSGYNLVDGFSEKLRLLGYEAPKEEKGYKMIALDLAERVNRTASMSEEMMGIISKPLLDRIGLLEKEKAMVEARAAALEAKLAAMSIKEAK